ncbi:hypothetical protein Mal15_25060 [Stieleria maiorica]|uniref:DUF2169 domain-containing protein n=1 Tax=Stieleria maiorica TaxID=2795974 RepID=A0A5B9MFT4_9BACT|nr:DUF2169 domain-containing protein [Stieleria maiorica]QEF98454.1 hypothetical protein Mal15_25060 [Stieleria maiorica]
MELENTTPFPALLFRGAIDEDRFCASVTCRVTYDLTDRGLVLSQEQPWIVSAEPWEGPHGGPMDSDEVFYRGGVDVLVFGQACPFRDDPTRGQVVVRVGDSFQSAVSVFGDRVWVERDGDLVPGQPQPFRSMPLELSHAYGGSDVWDELDIPYADNPAGRGYYLSRESAAGSPLPNLEDPANPISQWDDQGEPVATGTVPMAFGPKLKKFMVIDEVTGEMKKLDPRLFNSAFPHLIVDSVQPGQHVIVDGVFPHGSLAFAIPNADLEVVLQFDEEQIVAPLKIDQIGIECESKRVFIGWRYPFRYRFYPMQKRSCALRLRQPQT